MNKAELIQAVAEKSGLTKKQAEAAVAAVLDSVTDAMKAGNWLKAMGDRLKVIGRMANFDFSVDLKVYLSIFNFYPKSTKLYTLNK